VIIHNDVWLGLNVVVLPGVEIKEGAVIGAGAVVTKDVEPYTVSVGVPAKPVRIRCTNPKFKMCC
jgi:acetyltransferase-like isoleucine patch superfamily enzyme